jgi:hypothetical protein
MNAAADPRQNPYVGLDPFESAHAAYFFGRQRESKIIADHVLARPITVLYGPSGVGKSSILNVGLPVALQQIAELARRENAEAFREESELGGDVGLPVSHRVELDWIVRNLREWQEPVDATSLLMTWAAETASRPVLIILDQFEEYFLYGSRGERLALDRALRDLVARRGPSVHLLISIRDDALHQLDQLRAFIPGILDATIELGRLSEAGVRDAIRGPIDRYNVAFRPPGHEIKVEDELVDALIAQLREPEAGVGRNSLAPPEGRRIELPYLQIALTKLWDEEGGRAASALRNSTLARLRGVGEIIRTHVKQVMERLSPDEQELCAKIFDRLVTSIGSKIAYPTEGLEAPEVVGRNVPPDQVVTVLRKLTLQGARILKPVIVGRLPGFEIFHDVLGLPILEWKYNFQVEQEVMEKEAERLRAEEAARQERELARQREAEAVQRLREQKEEEDKNRAQETARQQRERARDLRSFLRSFLDGLRARPQRPDRPATAYGPSPLHPPKPRLVLRIGFVGIRPAGLNAAATANLARELPRLFGDLEAVLSDIHARYAQLYSDDPPLIRFVCGFAAGADQIAVDACRPGWSIEAVLPFSREEYLKDFDANESIAFRAALAGANSVTELPDPQTAGREYAYALAGSYVLRQVDLLIGVWDGSSVRAGSVGAMAKAAFDAGTPVVWLPSTGLQT